jgi:UDP-2,4-diacetamido-2,4,6-trideoxy-beta-L-altropyranose hydrolase
MMPSGLLVRADAGQDIGLGHVMRTLALAAAWQARGGEVVCVTTDTLPTVAERWHQMGATVVLLPATATTDPQAAAWQAAMQAQPDAWIILDGYGFGPDYQRATRTAGARVLVIDDHAHHPHYEADLLLNPNPDATERHYAGTLGPRLLGPAYAPLRPEILPRRRPYRGGLRVGRLLITMGGADPRGLTGRVLAALSATPWVGEVVVIVGAACRDLPTIRAAAAERAATVVVDPPDIGAWFAWADAAVTAAGSTCWELAYVGVPALLVVAADNQAGIAAGLVQTGAAVSAGWHETLAVPDLARALADFLTSPGLGHMAAAGQALVDGRGAERVVAAMRALGR